MSQPVEPPQGTAPQEEGLRLDIDIEQISNEMAAIEGQMVGQLTKDLASQRAISTALQKKVQELTQEVKFQQEIIMRLEGQLNPPSPEVKDLEHAERVLDQIIEEGTSSTNGDKPAAKEVPSPARPTRPPVKEKVEP